MHTRKDSHVSETLKIADSPFCNCTSTTGTKNNPYHCICLFFICRSKLNSKSHSKTRKRPHRVAKQADKPSAKRSLSFRSTLLGFSGDYYLKPSSHSQMAYRQHTSSCLASISSSNGISNDVYSIPVRRSMMKYYHFENAQNSNTIVSNGNILCKPPFPMDGHKCSCTVSTIYGAALLVCMTSLHVGALANINGSSSMHSNRTVIHKMFQLLNFST